MYLYFDICALQRPFDERTDLRVHAEAEAIIGLLTQCEAGRYSVIASAAHVIENQRNPYRERRAYVDRVLGMHSRFQATTPAVAERMRRYQDAGLHVLDALHLAAAVEAQATFFCTTDDRLLKRGRVVDTNTTRVVSPLELVLALDAP